MCVAHPRPARSHALGRFPDDVVWQVDEGAFQPWRRRIDYVGAREAPVRALQDRLELTSAAHWGHGLRRGLVALSEHDFELIRAAMTGDAAR